MAKVGKSGPTTGADEQVEAFLAKFEPDVADAMRGAGRRSAHDIPTAIEQVYDNYNFFVIGFCTTERTSDCIVSLAASANGVALSFYNGAALADPDAILLGAGKQNRFIRRGGAQERSATRKSSRFSPPRR